VHWLALVLRVWKIVGRLWVWRDFITIAWVNIAPLLLAPALAWTLGVVMSVPGLATGTHICWVRRLLSSLGIDGCHGLSFKLVNADAGASGEAVRARLWRARRAVAEHNRISADNAGDDQNEKALHL